MKKLFLSLILSFLLITGFKVNAEEVNPNQNSVTEEELPKAGVKPGSVFYKFDLFFERLSLKLTISDEKRVEKLSKIAEERLAELNEIDEEKAKEWADKLFDEYGVNLEKADQLLAKLVLEGKIKQELIEKLQARVEKATSIENKIKSLIKEKINKDIKDKVQDIKINSYLTAMSSSLSKDQLNKLREEKFGYGEIVKLSAIAKLSDKTIEEVLALDIYKIEDDKKEIDFNKVLVVLNITKEELELQLKEFHKSIKEEREALRQELQIQREENKTKNKQKLEELKKLREELKKRQEDAKEKRDETLNKVKEKMNQNRGK